MQSTSTAVQSQHWNQSKNLKYYSRLHPWILLSNWFMLHANWWQWIS